MAMDGGEVRLRRKGREQRNGWEEGPDVQLDRKCICYSTPLKPSAGMIQA